MYAKHNDGEVVLRFEDTDTERSKKEFEKFVIDGLDVLGLKFDHGPYRQSERGDVYNKRLKELVDSGKAYEAEESTSGDGKVIRFKNPNKTITFNDKVRGEISFESSIFEDFVIARNIKSPIYHFAVVVDDIDMGITHVIRGEDHITSTPRQILLIEALGEKVPEYAHLPLITGDDNKKLSKRHGATSVSGFLKQGYLPEALVNYLAFLGWNPGGEREIYSLKEMTELFSLEKVGKNPARFDYNKLNDINFHYMVNLSEEDYRKNLLGYLDEKHLALFEKDEEFSNKIIKEVIKTRIKKFGEISEMIENGDLDYFYEVPKIDTSTINFKEDDSEKTKSTLQKTREVLENVSDQEWKTENIKTNLSTLLVENGTGSVLHPLRTILSGKTKSPDPFTLAYILGKEEVLKRIDLIK
jgi:glutamyl-tRNA synthetase